MSESAASLDLINALDASESVRKADGNNLQLAENFQFSSILKVFVTPPEKALEQAQSPVNPADELALKKGNARPDFASDRKTDLDDAIKLIPERPVAAPRESGTAKQKPNAGAAAPSSEQRPNRDDVSVEVDTDSITASVAGSIAGENRSAESHLKAQPNQNAANASAKAPIEVLAVATPAGPAAQAAQAVTENSAQSTRRHATFGQVATSFVASALTDKHFSDIGEKIHAAVNQEIEPDSNQSGNPSAASALKTRQQTNLAQKLGNGMQGFVEVSVKKDSQPARTPIGQSLAPGAVLADLPLTDDGITPTLDGQAKGSETGASAGRQGTHANANGNAGQALGRSVPTDGFANFGQAVRAQAMAVGLQNAANAANLDVKAQPITLDTTQLGSINGPTGPSQVSQTAKANPLTASRQPTPTRPPAEQIAVQIKKAIGAGADKINIRLNPESLGRVDVKLHIGKDGHVSAAISADKPETLDLLKLDARGLEKALADVGLRTNSDSLSFTLRGQAQQDLNAGKHGRRGFGGRPSERIDTPEAARDMGILQNENAYGRNLRANGGVDIRV